MHRRADHAIPVPRRRRARRAALAALPLTASSAPPAPAGKTELTWYGQSAFVLRTPGGTVLAIDPWFANPVSPDRDAGLEAALRGKAKVMAMVPGRPAAL